MSVMVVLFVLISNEISFAEPYPDYPLDRILSREERDDIGLDKLSAAEREKLRILIIERYLAGYENGKSAAEVITRQQSTPVPDAIESQIDGDFEGWEGETIVKLMNGQIWEQVEYHYHYHYAFMPSVLVYKSGGGYKMKVDGVDKAVGVIQLK